MINYIIMSYKIRYSDYQNLEKPRDLLRQHSLSLSLSSLSFFFTLSSLQSTDIQQDSHSPCMSPTVCFAPSNVSPSILTTPGPHPLLAQVPLTVSPFINLPTPVTLPYTYKSVPSTLPPSVTVDPNNPDAKPRYVISSSGEHAASPEEILASCQSLKQHLDKMRADADHAIRAWEESITQRDLAEKRRLAPGWLDREEKLLRPTNAPTEPSSQSHPDQPSLLDSSDVADPGASHLPSMKPRDEGEELDRAFGGLGLQSGGG